MKLLDSNILIYSLNPEYGFLKEIVFNKNNAVSVITQIEVLGFHKISEQEKLYFEFIFSQLHILDLQHQIVQRAIELKQSKKMELPDATIAATALFYDLQLITRNTKDYIHIPDLNITNPIDINT
jgi:predicted nucleic acid-binding protein